MEKSELQAKIQRPRCPFCHEDVSPGDDEKTLCNDCLAVHHEACWSEHGGCSSCGMELPSEPIGSPVLPVESVVAGKQSSLGEANELFESQHPVKLGRVKMIEYCKNEAARFMIDGNYDGAARVLFKAMKLDQQRKKDGEVQELDYEIEDASHKVLSKIGKDALPRLMIVTLLCLLVPILILFALSSNPFGNISNSTVWISVFAWLASYAVIFSTVNRNPLFFQKVSVRDSDAYIKSPKVNAGEIRRRFSGLLR